MDAKGLILGLSDIENTPTFPDNNNNKNFDYELSEVGSSSRQHENKICVARKAGQKPKSHNFTDTISLTTGRQ